MEATCEVISCPRELWEGGKRGQNSYIPQRGSTFSMNIQGWAGTSQPAWIIQVQHGQGEVRKEEPQGPTGFSPSHCTPLPSQGRSDPQEDSLQSTDCSSKSLAK